MTLGRAEILELLAANDVRPSRALGQNFVADGNTVRRIVRLSGVGPGQRVVEIGAGLGSLTLALAEAGASVTAVEIDRHVLPVLRAQVEPVGVRVVEADALTLDWPGLLDGPPSDRWSMVSNLPYNMAVPLVVRVLEEAPRVVSLLVMVQREVGERLVARVGDDAYGAVSVKVAYWATSALVGRVPASVFIPRPRVESVLVRLDRHRADPAHPADPADPADLADPADPADPADLADPADREAGGGSARDQRPDGPGSEHYDRLFSVVRAGFAHRRKMLRRSLDGTVVAEAYSAVGIRPTARAEELSLVEWERLAAWPDRPQTSEPLPPVTGSPR